MSSNVLMVLSRFSSSLRTTTAADAAELERPSSRIRVKDRNILLRAVTLAA